MKRKGGNAHFCSQPETPKIIKSYNHEIIKPSNCNRPQDSPLLEYLGTYLCTFSECLFFSGLGGLRSMSATPSTTGGVESPTVLVESLGNQVTVCAANTRSAIPSPLIKTAVDGYRVEVHIRWEPEVA